MTQDPRPEHRHLDAPPIVEVACGFAFEPLDGFDVFHLGRFWGELADEYPGRQAQPAIGAVPLRPLDELQLRGWFESADRTNLVQLQHDRLICNWRRGDSAYPRFRTRGDAVGLRDTSIAVYHQFRDYWQERSGAPPALRVLELTKVDRFERGVHWTTPEDLAALALPLGFLSSTGMAVTEPRMDLYTEGSVRGVTTRVRWQTQITGPQTTAVLLTTTAQAPAPNAIADGLDRLDDVVDDVFFSYLTPRALALFGAQR